MRDVFDRGAIDEHCPLDVPGVFGGAVEDAEEGGFACLGVCVCLCFIGGGISLYIW